MEGQISAIVCPNCGATTTNHQNCDFCGSLLVRFEGAGVDLEQTSYLSNSFCLPGLLDALEENLRLQYEHPKSMVATFVIDPFHETRSIVNSVCSVLSSDKLFSLHKRVSGRLAVSLGFSQVVGNVAGYESYNLEKQKHHDAFTKLPSCQLFRRKIEFSEIDGHKYKNYTYDIDFGGDAEGAARIISEVAIKVFGCSPERPLEYHTNWGFHTVLSAAKLTGYNLFGEGCYIATCVYGSYDCPEVWTLRRYRDEILEKSWFGRLFIKTYYAVSPVMVKWFGRSVWFKRMWKPFLDRMVANLRAKGVEDTPYVDKY